MRSCTYGVGRVGLGVRCSTERWQRHPRSGLRTTWAVPPKRMRLTPSMPRPFAGGCGLLQDVNIPQSNPSPIATSICASTDGHWRAQPSRTIAASTAGHWRPTHHAIAAATAGADAASTSATAGHWRPGPGRQHRRAAETSAAATRQSGPWTPAAPAATKAGNWRPGCGSHRRRGPHRRRNGHDGTGCAAGRGGALDRADSG